VTETPREEPAPVEPARPEPVTPTPTEPPREAPDGTTTTPEAAPAPAPVLVAALPGSSIRYREPGGAEGELAGEAGLPPGTRLLGGRQGGALRVGQGTCVVDAQATVALHEPAGGVARVEVLEGQVSVDAAGATIEVACGPAVVRPAASGVYMVVAHEGPERAL